MANLRFYRGIHGSQEEPELWRRVRDGFILRITRAGNYRAHGEAEGIIIYLQILYCTFYDLYNKLKWNKTEAVIWKI